MGKTSRISPVKRDGKYTTQALSKALVVTDGRVYLAAERLGCSPRTIYLRLEKEPELQELLRDIRGRFLDLAETALHQAVVKGEGWAVCFTLKTLGKERGYSERHEVATPPGQPLQVENTSFTDEERAKRIQEIFERVQRRGELGKKKPGGSHPEVRPASRPRPGRPNQARPVGNGVA